MSTNAEIPSGQQGLLSLRFSRMVGAIEGDITRDAFLTILGDSCSPFSLVLSP